MTGFQLLLLAEMYQIPHLLQEAQKALQLEVDTPARRW